MIRTDCFSRNRHTVRVISTNCRILPSTGFEKIPQSRRIEEETFPGYETSKYYPVRLEEVFQSIYQIVAKLGYGRGQSSGFARISSMRADHRGRDAQHNADFIHARCRANILLALKVCVSGEDASNELDISNKIKSIDAENPGKDRLRVVLDAFEIKGLYDYHQCLLFTAQGLTFTDFRALFPENGLNLVLLRQTLLLILLGLDFIHQVGVVHAGKCGELIRPITQSLIFDLDLSPNNILLGVDDPGALDKVEQTELKSPLARKVLPDRPIYLSYTMPVTYGPPVISAFGAARLGGLGQKHIGTCSLGSIAHPRLLSVQNGTRKSTPGLSG